MNKVIAFLMRPYGIVIFTVSCSFVAWIFPDFGFLRKGFDRMEPILDEGGLTVGGWYAMIILSSIVGYAIGVRTAFFSSRWNRSFPLDSPVLCWWFRGVATIGVAATWLAVVSALGVGGVVAALQDSQANAFKKLIYDDYSIGLLSLRYVAILVGALAIFRVMLSRKVGFLDIYDFLALAMTAIMSSRLSLIVSLVIAGALWFSHERVTAKMLRNIVVVLVVFFAITTLLNASRNAGFYRERGLGNPMLANVSEILSYMGSPFQGALSAGNDYMRAVRGGGDVADVESGLTTNSAILELLQQYGNLAWMIMFAASVSMSAVMGMISRTMSSVLGIVYGIELYCFSEIWRIFMFGRGIIVTLIIVTLAAIPIQILVDVIKSRWRSPGARSA